MIRAAAHFDHVRDNAAPVDFNGPDWTPLPEAVARSLRGLWWYARRRGNPLPAKRGLIVIDGGAHGR